MSIKQNPQNLSRTAKANVEPVRQRTQYSWADQPLGMVPDAFLAKRLGVGKTTVLRARNQLGIAPFDPSRSKKGIDWDTQPLGKMPDSEIALSLGVATSVVLNARKCRGIRHFGLPSLDADWDNLPLGEVTDEALARLLGTTQATVTRQRNKRGILPSKATYITQEGEGANYPEALIDLYWHEKSIPHRFQPKIGPYRPDWLIYGDTLVEYAGFSASNRWGEAYKVRLEHKRLYLVAAGWKVQVIWPVDLGKYDLGLLPEVSGDSIPGGINWSKEPLGLLSDTDLAAQLGVTQSTVTRRRNLLGIPAFKPAKRDWSRLPLGLEPDPALAQRLGVSKETVRRARIERGITSFKETCRAT